jgi:hypothetical protein
MLLEEELETIWESWENGQPPSVKLAKYREEWFYTLEDHRSVYFFMTVSKVTQGKKENLSKSYKVFAAVKSKCYIKNDHYVIAPEALKIVSCNKIFNSRQEFLINQISSPD